jgi:GDP-D-mannose 3',5'-epimerase
MKILITGGAGMIGSNLSLKLLQLGHEVTIIDNLFRGKLEYLSKAFSLYKDRIHFYNFDLSQKGEWEVLFNNIDVVYDLADVVAGIGYVFKNQSDIFSQNLLINSNVRDAVSKFKVNRYIYPGTACSFPCELQKGTNATPLQETDQIPANPESAYGWSKLMGELGAKFLSVDHDIDSVILILHNVYGSPCDYKSEKSQVIPALIHKCLESKHSNKQFIVWGDGNQGRAFVHISDTVDSLLQSLTKGENCGPIQIGPSECTSINSIANIIRSYIDPSIEIIYDTSKPTGDLGRCANYSKARKILDWEPRVGINEGVCDLIDWIRQN